MKQDWFFSKSALFLPLILYIFINGLFVIKYGVALQWVNSFVLFSIYLVLIFAVLFFFEKSKLQENFFRYAFWFIVPLFFIFILFLTQYVKLESLNVDRLDALDSGIKAVLQGDYPYDIVNRLGNESSNLPLLIIIGIPFYLLFGSAVYLQSFCFLLFSYLIFKYFKTYKLRVLALVLLILSPGYIYELYVKSDLMSNFILAVGFIILIWTYFIKSPVMKLPNVAILSGLLLLTRIPVIFPLAVLLLRKFTSLGIRSKIIFTAVFIATISIILGVFMMMAPNLQIILDHNPFMLQSKQPVYLSLLLIGAAAICSFKIKDLNDIMLLSSILLFSSVSIAFILAILKNGFRNTFFESYFDISHFNMAIPFIILSLTSGIYFKRKISTKIDESW